MKRRKDGIWSEMEKKRRGSLKRATKNERK